MPQRLTSATTDLLTTLASDFPLKEGTWGRNLAAATGLATGTVYPMLKRLQREGLTESVEEPIDPELEGRPRRIYWRLTPNGAEFVRDLRASRAARTAHAKALNDRRRVRDLWATGGAQ